VDTCSASVAARCRVSGELLSVPMYTVVKMRCSSSSALPSSSPSAYCPTLYRGKHQIQGRGMSIYRHTCSTAAPRFVNEPNQGKETESTRSSGQHRDCHELAPPSAAMASQPTIPGNARLLVSAACTNAYEGRTSRSLNTHLRASASAWGSPPAAALTTICAMAPTMAAVELLSAPPDNGSRYPLAPLQQ